MRSILMMSPLVALLASGCAHGVRDEKVEARSAATTTTYCRKVGTKGWIILPSSAADFTSENGRSFEVVKEYGPSSPIIEEDDTFKLAEKGDGRLKLTHYRGRTTVAEAILVIDSSGLWARGPIKTSADDGGEYVVYRIPDRAPGTAFLCRHSKKDSETCRALHFEYFADTDAGNYSGKPKLNGNVVTVASPQLCVGGPSQTDDGDGDHGPD